MKKFTRWHLLEGIILILIIALAAFLRLVNLQNNPAWYTDEATHLDIATNLLDGRIQYMSVTQSTLFFARLPLFEIILAAGLKWFGDDILTLRTLTALLNTFSVGLLWLVTRRLSLFIASEDTPLTKFQHRLLPLLAAFMFAIYPQAILYSRFGFSYNLLSPLILLIMLGLGDYHRTMHRRCLLLAALSIGIGTTSDLMMFTMFVPFILIISIRRWHDSFWAIPLALLPFTIYVAFMLHHDSDAFIFDLNYTLNRLQGVPLTQQLSNMADNYTILISQDFWFIGALFGLFLMPPTRLSKLVALILLTPIIVLGRTIALHGLSFYYLIPILPMVAFGMAALLCFGIPRLWIHLFRTVKNIVSNWTWLPNRLYTPYFQQYTSILLSGALTLFLTISPFLVTLDRTADSAQNSWQTIIDPFLINPDHAHEVAAYINAHIQSNDTVIVSPAIAWLIHADVVDFTIAPAQIIDERIHFWGLRGKSAMPLRRFAHDPRYTSAHYVVIDNLWYTWGIHHAEGAWEMLTDVRDTWAIVFQTDTITVYINPALSQN
jgi:hypothetical protein